MDLLLLLIAIAGIIWTMIYFQWSSPLFRCAVVVVSGICLGHAFFNRSFGPIPVTIDRILWGLALVEFAALLYLGKQNFRRLDKMDWVILCLMAILTTSTLLNDWRYRNDEPISRLLFFNLMPIGLYFVVSRIGFTWSQLKFSILLFCFVGVYLATTAVAEWRGWHGIVFPKYILSADVPEFLGRGRGPLLNPVANGVIITICMICSILMWHHVKRHGKALILICLPVFAAGIYATLTRSVWLAAAVSLAMVFWLTTTQRFRAVVVFAAATGIFIFSVGGFEHFNKFKRDKYVTETEMAKSADLRPLLATVATRMWMDRPVFGHGFGQYTKYKKPYHTNTIDGQPLRMVLPYMQHNVFLSYLTETGLLGTLTLLSVLLLGTAWSWRLWARGTVNSPSRIVALLFMVMVTNYVINGLAHDVSIVPMIGMMLFFILGLTMNVLHREDDSRMGFVDTRITAGTVA